MHTKQIVICTGMRLANHEKESPLIIMHVYTVIVFDLLIIIRMQSWPINSFERQRNNKEYILPYFT